MTISQIRAVPLYCQPMIATRGLTLETREF